MAPCTYDFDKKIASERVYPKAKCAGRATQSEMQVNAVCSGRASQHLNASHDLDGLLLAAAVRLLAREL